MASEPVFSPPLSSPAWLLVDWLEFVAFFNEYGVARLDSLVTAIDGQKDGHEDDISAQDQMLDRLLDDIENEINFRKNACERSYPFELSNDAEEFRLSGSWSAEEYEFYLVCLLSSHLTGSPLLNFEVHADVISSLRNRVFQVVSTLAMAGLAGGSAVSVGWPRTDKATVIATLKRAQARGAGIIARDNPGVYVRPREKDGGIDVISWSIDDRPPPTIFYYAQAASGHNWPGKPVSVHVKVFEPNYIDDAPRGNTSYATLIPFRETDLIKWHHEHRIHGA